MNTHQVHTKIGWQEDIGKNWEEVFYPSLVKKIRKSDEYFSELFDFSVDDLNEERKKMFFSLYEKEIVSRENYIFAKDEQLKILNDNIASGRRYALSSFTLKETGEFCGGVIFSIREKEYSAALRTFKKEIRNKYRSQTTLDFWAEKVFYEYARSQGVPMLTHGTDRYPNVGRIGLPLFKLKIGGRPRIAKKSHDILNLNDEDLQKEDEPTLFWEKPNSETFFEVCHLFYKEGKIDESVLGELKKVLEWANIKFEVNC